MEAALMTKEMSDSDFLVAYQRLEKEYYSPTRLRLRTMLIGIQDEAYLPNTQVPNTNLVSRTPVQGNRTRIKRPESIVDKIKRKPEDYPQGLSQNSLTRMHDIVGGRLVVYFLSDLKIIDEIIRNSPELELSATDTPEAFLADGVNPSGLDLDRFKITRKDSGYLALHYTARFRQESPTTTASTIWFEIQVRTVAEDCWAEIEHALGYKTDGNIFPDIQQQFKILSSLLQAIDRHFDLIAETLAQRQKDVRVSELDAGTRLNPVILPALLAELNLRCPQKEIDGMLKVLTSRKVDTVMKMRTALTSPRFHLIVDTYSDFEDRTPIPFEYVANLPHILYAESDDEAISLIHSQIEYDKAWKEISRDMQR
jgi:putative GTP pyrophosphokinase